MAELKDEKDVLRLSNEELNKLTKECLEFALIELISEKDFEDISVTEIVNKAGVSRSAFYRNFQTKETLLKAIGETYTKQIAARLEQERYYGNDYLWFYDCFKDMKEEKRAIKILLKANVQYEFFGTANSILLKIFPAKDLKQEYQLVALEGAFSAILNHWVENNMEETPEQLASLCIELLEGLTIFGKGRELKKEEPSF